MAKLVRVDRARWLNGHVSAKRDVPSQLHSNNPRTLGMKCCLGFACDVADISEQRQAGIGMPTGFADLALERRWSDTFGHNWWNLRSLAQLNDNRNDTLSGKEALIALEGLNHGIQFEFYGEYPKDIRGE